MNFIKLENVSKTYKNLTVLKNVTMEIEKGEFVGILGPSGCGKSTLLTLISGLEKISSGHLKNNSTKRKSAFVFQDSCLMPWKNLEQNIAIPLEILNTPQKEISEKVNKYLQILDLQKFKKHFPRELSGGMKMRASIARALITDPEVILMDEPFAALDQILRERLADEIYEIYLKKKLTSVFVTHNIAEAVSLCNRIYIFSAHPGKIIGQIKIEKDKSSIKNYRNSEDFHKNCVKIRTILENQND
ncbi:ABC transporter ATP-binding protein [Fluviispira sanaruensis]|uniref:ABC transporter ATP-binding protein n=1 Tax=Fluviispira sanaruensis TaxID=2493639 RepID=A0A4V0P2A3_FLUSA|nr:ABC transporter ATP-binding protein [Fluviispira sanaruensis]BBH52527.1 ABC transporter ATP-binding protein [Fluviispira sanaruensis]